MQFQIVSGQLPQGAAAAVVKPLYLPEKPSLFAPRPGKVSLIPLQNGAAQYELQVVCPATPEETTLRRCYRQCLKRAVQAKLPSVALPLLSPDASDLPLAIALIREFLLDHPVQVYLVLQRPELFQLSPEKRHLLNAYFERRRAKKPSPELPPQPPAPMAFPSAAPVMASKQARPSPGKASLTQWLTRADAGFSETLLKLIDQTGKKDSDIYNKANVSRQHFSKIRNNPHYSPTKATAIAFAIALELNMEQTADLIGRAGYALTPSSTFDLIIMYFIENKNYNLFEINEALYEFDQRLLGV